MSSQDRWVFNGCTSVVKYMLQRDGAGLVVRTIAQLELKPVWYPVEGASGQRALGITNSRSLQYRPTAASALTEPLVARAVPPRSARPAYCRIERCGWI